MAEGQEATAKDQSPEASARHRETAHHSGTAAPLGLPPHLATTAVLAGAGGTAFLAYTISRWKKCQSPHPPTAQHDTSLWQALAGANQLVEAVKWRLWLLGHVTARGAAPPTAGSLGPCSRCGDPRSLVHECRDFAR